MAKVIFLVVIGTCVFAAWSMQVGPANETGQEQRQAIEKAVRSTHAELKTAAEHLDVDTLFAHVLETDKGSIIENGRLMRTRQDALESTRRGLRALKGISYTYKQSHITVMSATSALWVAEGTAVATLEDGREISAPFAESLIFVQQDGKWKILHGHRSTPNPR